MSGISIHITNTRLSPENFREVCDGTLAYCEDISPVRSGYFQAHWEMDWAEDEATIYNFTPYGEYLDEGSSNQAPNGISGPAVAYLRSLVAQFE